MVRISTLLNILAYCIALTGYAPLFPYLEPIPRLVLPAAVVTGLFADRRGTGMGGHLSTLLSLVFFLFYLVQINRANLVGPVTSLLMILLALRLVSEKKGRHYLQIFALSLFALAASSLYSLDYLFLVYLIVLFFMIAVALVLLTFHGEDEEMVLQPQRMRSVVATTLIIPAAALPLMVCFFLILPRTQFPMWNLFVPPASATTGFSEKVEPGITATVGETKRPVFRAECDRMDRSSLYWRGKVLSRFTGRAWLPDEVPAGEYGTARGGKSVSQTIYPEPGWTSTLFSLNMPVAFSGVRGRMGGDLVFSARSMAGARMKYRANSLAGAIITVAGGIDREHYLGLPSGISYRMAAVGKRIALEQKSDLERVEALKSYFAGSNLHYATSGLPVSADPMDEFLFVKKRGNCEFFASSFALLLRSAGVPARLVGGYLGGNYNEMAGYYLVTEGMAHVWVEAYIDGKGWISIDPSAYAVGFTGNSTSDEGLVAQQLRMALDSWEYYWNRAVIGYDLDRQFQLAQKANIGIKRLASPDFSGKGLLPLAAATMCILMTAMYVRKRRTSLEQRLLRRFLKSVRAAYNGEVLPSMGVLELAALSGDPKLNEFAARYSRAIYRDVPLTREEYLALVAILYSR